MTWLLAGLFAGIVSGAVAWLISLFYKGLYVGGLVNELTTFAAFTALLTFLMAIAGVALGHWLIDRHADDAPRQHHGLAAGEDRADTDVFAAVRHPDAPADEDTDRARARNRPSPARARIAQREQVALYAEPDDDAGGDRTQVGVVPKLFPGMHIGDVHFDQRGAEFGARIPQRNRGVRQRAGVEYHRFAGVGGAVDPAQQLCFAVRSAAQLLSGRVRWPHVRSSRPDRRVSCCRTPASRGGRGGPGWDR